MRGKPPHLRVLIPPLTRKICANRKRQTLTNIALFCIWRLGGKFTNFSLKGKKDG